MVNISVHEDRVVFGFPPRLDTVTCQGMDENILSKIQEDQKMVVFDMKGVEYISSSFLRLMVQAGKKAGSQRFRLDNVSPLVKKVLKVSGFEGMFPIS